MADDDKGEKPGTPLPVQHAAAGIEPEVPSSKPEAQKIDDPTHTEWTASDRRGPLGSAEDEDLERVVPAHETDAEGGVDPAAHVVEPVALAHHDASEHRDDALPHDEAIDGTHEPASDEPIAPAPVSTVGEPAGAAPVRAAEPERRRSLMPVAAGLVIGALIGAGSAWLVYSQADDGGDDKQVAALSQRVDALDKRPDPQPEIAKLQARLGEVQGKVAALAKQPASATAGASDAGLAGKVAALQTAVDALKARAPAGGQQASAKPSGASGETPTASGQPGSAKSQSSDQPEPAAEAALPGKVAALQAALDELKTRTAALQAQDAQEKGTADTVATLKGSVADAKKQAAGAQSALDAVKGEQKQLGDKLAGLTVAVAGALKKADGAQEEAKGAQSGVAGVRDQQKALEGKLGSPAMAVVADSLVQQIDAGQPFTRQVDALAALSADPAKVAVLRENAAHGVPSAQALLAKWQPLEDPVIATGNSAPANANFGQRLEHGLFGLVSVRRADVTTNNDLSSRVNLIAADLAHDDVAGAYATWQALPDGAKGKSASWGALAKTSVEALSAARDLQHSAIDALGAKKP